MDHYSRSGLRTLVMAYREISKQEVDELKNKLQEVAESGLSKNLRQSALQEHYQKVEQGLRYVGCSAIEDRLQDDVPDTIALLISANIRVWVLTGDKQETAIEIGRMCKLIGGTGQIAEEILSLDEELLGEAARAKSSMKAKIDTTRNFY